MLPLAYFIYLAAAMRSWYSEMIRDIRRNPDNIDLKETFDRFQCLTKINARMAGIFNPFITLSILIALVQISFSIYFITNTDDFLGKHYWQSTNMSDADIYKANLRNGFELSWVGVQIAIAVIFLIGICATCWQCNEEVCQLL